MLTRYCFFLIVLCGFTDTLAAQDSVMRHNLDLDLKPVCFFEKT